MHLISVIGIVDLWTYTQHTFTWTRIFINAHLNSITHLGSRSKSVESSSTSDHGVLLSPVGVDILRDLFVNDDSKSRLEVEVARFALFPVATALRFGDGVGPKITGEECSSDASVSDSRAKISGLSMYV